MAAKRTNAEAGPAEEAEPAGAGKKSKHMDPTDARHKMDYWQTLLRQMEVEIVPRLTAANPMFQIPWKTPEYSIGGPGFHKGGGNQARCIWLQLMLDALNGRVTLTHTKKMYGFWGISGIHATLAQVSQCSGNVVPFVEESMPKERRKTVTAIWKRAGFTHPMIRAMHREGCVEMTFDLSNITTKKDEAAAAVSEAIKDRGEDAPSAAPAGTSAGHLGGMQLGTGPAGSKAVPIQGQAAAFAMAVSGAPGMYLPVSNTGQALPTVMFVPIPAQGAFALQPLVPLMVPPGAFTLQPLASADPQAGSSAAPLATQASKDDTDACSALVMLATQSPGN